MPPPKGNRPELPEWWKALRVPRRLAERLLNKFTLTADGYVLWYAGRTRRAAPKGLPPAQVDAAWEAKRRAIDDKAAQSAQDAPGTPDGPLSYRSALTEFLGVQKARIGAVRNRLEERSYHNLVYDLNRFGEFEHAGRKVADMDIDRIGPAVFSGYARRLGAWKASGFDSVVSRVSALFRWAEGQGYVERFRTGPEFRRPAKQDIRDERIDLTKSFEPAGAARLYRAANHTMRCWIALGVCAAFTNSDIAHATRPVMGLHAGGVIDYRRRKKGRVRRVIPLPPDVVTLLREYERPAPARDEWADLFFLTVEGQPYSRTLNAAGKFKPSCSISRLFAKVRDAQGLGGTRGQGFTGLRTAFYNLCPPDGYEIERKIIMGRAKGTVDLDSYLERIGMERLSHVVLHVWSQVKAEIDKQDAEAAAVSTLRPPSRPAGSPADSAVAVG